jgi:hypothetical protein
MNRLLALLQVLRRPTLWAVALCYALLLQAALTPVVRAAHDPVLTDAVAAVLCLGDIAGDGSGHDPGQVHDVDCCLAAQRAAAWTPALPPGLGVTIPAALLRLAGQVRPLSSGYAPPSVDLLVQGARGPPASA